MACVRDDFHEMPPLHGPPLHIASRVAMETSQAGNVVPTSRGIYEFPEHGAARLLPTARELNIEDEALIPRWFSTAGSAPTLDFNAELPLYKTSPESLPCPRTNGFSNFVVFPMLFPA